MAAPFTYVDSRLVYKQGSDKEVVLGFVRNPPVGEDMAEALNRILQDELQNTLPLTNTIKVPKGCVLITEERRKQLKKYGVEQDAAKYPMGQLVIAVNSLLIRAAAPEGWKKAYWSKLVSRGYIERLQIAGAWLAAELDRMHYANDVTKVFRLNDRFVPANVVTSDIYTLLPIGDTNMVGLVAINRNGDLLDGAVNMVRVADRMAITQEELKEMGKGISDTFIKL